MTGKPVTLTQLADAADRSDDAVTAAVGHWHNVAYDDDGAIVAFGGLSLTPTPHSFRVDGRELFTWCAWDTLFLPALLDAPAEIRSRCQVTGVPVAVDVDPARIRRAEPGPLWVTFPDPAGTTTADIVGSFCCNVHFVAGQDAANQWVSKHPSGFVLDLVEAHTLGMRATASLR